MNPVGKLGREADEARRARVTWLGLLLLLGFLMPVVVARGWPRRPALVFVNFEVTASDEAGSGLKFLALYPALAGTGVIFFAATCGGLLRGLGLLAIGIIPVLVAAFNTDAVPELARAIGLESGGLGRLMLVSFIGWTGAFVSSRAVLHGPDRGAGPLIGAVAASLYLLGLFVPAGQGSGWSRFPFLLPFALMPADETFLLGVAAFAQMLCLVGSSFLALLCVRRRSRRMFGGWLFGFTAAALAAFTLGVFTQAFRFVPEHERWGPAFTGLSVLAKVFCSVSFLAAVLPVGLADLVVRVGGGVEEEKR